MMRVAKNYGLATFSPVKIAFRTTFCMLAVVSTIGASSASANVALAGLGSDNFTILDSIGSFSQSPTTLTANSPISRFDLVGGQFSNSYNWSGVSFFGIFMSAPGVSPDAGFTIEFFDPSINLINTYQGFASGLSTTSTFLPVSLSASGSGNLSAVSFLIFTWDNEGPGSVVLHSIAGAVAPVLWSSAGGNAWLAATNWTGAAVPSSGDVAQFGSNPTSGVTPVGIDMGSNGGTQSVGAIEVTAARSAALLIENSSAATAGTLTLNGATINGVQNVILRNNSSQNLTLANGATADMTVALGNTTDNVIVVDDSGGITISNSISGSGRRLTKAGSGTGFLTLRAANTFSGATTVSAGTLRLDSSAGDALGSTASVTIASGATLLISRSNQVNDSAAISLTGGTITRGVGVNETFGNLSVTGSGFLDFGTGATGELRFGNYTPSALLTVHNFLPGNRLVFVGSDLSGLIDDPGLFSFQGAFSSAWNSGTSTFTVTAIPEASTWFAVALLVALCAGGMRRTGRNRTADASGPEKNKRRSSA